MRKASVTDSSEASWSYGCVVTGRCCAVERQEDLKLLEMAPGGGDALAKGKVLVPKALDADDEEDAESDDESDDDEARLSPLAALPVPCNARRTQRAMTSQTMMRRDSHPWLPCPLSAVRGGRRERRRIRR